LAAGSRSPTFTASASNGPREERTREPVISHAEHGFVVALHLDRGRLLKRRDEALPRPRVRCGVTAEDPVLASGSEDAHDRIDVTALFGIGQRLHGFDGRAEREHSTSTKIIFCLNGSPTR
jgi:hypothetical protein